MTIAGLECIRCGAHQPLRSGLDGCPICTDFRSNLRVRYADAAASRWAEISPVNGGSLWRYAPMLPVVAEQPVSLHEGGTPLHRADTMGRQFGLKRLYLKDETRNPTWSYKDRLSTVAVTAARQVGAKVLATASSGNAGASLAAYAARAGMPCVVFTYARTSGPMLSQIRKYGAKVVPLERKQDRWPMLAACARAFGWFVTSPYTAPVVGSHPLGVEGYKTLAYEICESLDWNCPDWVVLPVCYGDALAGAWYGFQELHEAGVIDRLPRMVAAEVFGSLTRALADGLDHVPNMPAPFEPLAVSVGASQSAFQALKAIRDSGGLALPVPNDGLIAMQERLGRTEGIFAELTAAMPVLAIDKLAAVGRIQATDIVVGVVTASGLKDLDKSAGMTGAAEAVPGTFDEVVRHLEDRLNFHPGQAA